MMQSFATLPSLAGLGSLSLLTSAAICFSLSLLLIPMLERHALVHPNSRSSHKKPTPQGGGIAVIAATTIVISAVSLFFPDLLDQPSNLFVVFASAIVLGVVGVEVGHVRLDEEHAIGQVGGLNTLGRESQGDRGVPASFEPQSHETRARRQCRPGEADG